MKKMFLLFSHTLNDTQKQDAKNIYGITDFILLEQNLQKLWSNVPPENDNLNEFLKPFKEQVKDLNKNDIVLIQGDFGATYEMIKFAQNLGLTCVYATTKRDVQTQIIDGKEVKKSIFEHVRFREYSK